MNRSYIMYIYVALYKDISAKVDTYTCLIRSNVPSFYTKSSLTISWNFNTAKDITNIPGKKRVNQDFVSC